MCQKCADTLKTTLGEDPLPIHGVCLCPPDFVMMYRVKGEDRWVIGGQIHPPLTDVAEQAEGDAMEYLAGNYERWGIHCLHCGHLYAEGLA